MDSLRRHESPWRRPLRRFGPASAITAALLAVAPATASATITFGANLNRVLDNPANCNQVFFSFDTYPSCTA